MKDEDAGSTDLSRFLLKLDKGERNTGVGLMESQGESVEFGQGENLCHHITEELLLFLT